MTFDTPPGRRRPVQSPVAPPGVHPSSAFLSTEPPVSRKPKALLLSLSIVATLAACNREAAAPAADASAAKADAAPKLTLDESKLPGVNTFQVGDLDATKNACTDFNGYVNGKWLAANAIPGDRTSWGSMEVLDERSTSVQRQLAEQAAADAKATGVEKIVGDLWATGMDEAKIEAQGIKPLAGRLSEIDALSTGDAVADYLRSSAAKGEGYV